MQLHFDSTTDGPDDAMAIIVALTMRYSLADPTTQTVTMDPPPPLDEAALTAAFGAALPPPVHVAPEEAGVPFDPASSAPAPEQPAATDGPAAPATVPAPPAQPIASEQLDSIGMPWDARIHAGNRATVKDGTWRKKPGVDKETITAVENEIMNRSRTAPLAPAAAPAPPPPPAAAPPPPAPTAPAAPAAAPPPPAPAVASHLPPAAAATAPDAQAPATTRFSAVMATVTEALTAGRITQDEITGLGQAVLPSYASLADILTHEVNGSSPGLIANFKALLDATLAGRP